MRWGSDFQLNVKRVLKKLPALLLLAGALGASSFTVPARAAVLDWNFNFLLSNGDTGAGTFVTQDTPAGGPYLITSIQNGELNGATAMTLLAPNGAFNDNLLFPSGQPFDDVGLGFQTSDGVTWALWFDSGANSLLWCNNSVSGASYSCNTGSGDPLSYVTFSSVTPTPLPGALPLFGGGVGVIALLARRRRRKLVALAAA
jgi:hypothetical protein